MIINGINTNNKCNSNFEANGDIKLYKLIETEINSLDCNSTIYVLCKTLENIKMHVENLYKYKINNKPYIINNIEYEIKTNLLLEELLEHIRNFSENVLVDSSNIINIIENFKIT